jgi:FMN phosphatase YigB (HAD superfamily)
VQGAEAAGIKAVWLTRDSSVHAQNSPSQLAALSANSLVDFFAN